MAHNNRKIDVMLDKLEAHAGLTQAGRAWLIAACDPFHDQDLVLGGYPDVLSDSTIVQLVKQQLQIQVPPTTGNGAVAAGANWDCSIALFPQPINAELGFQTSITGGGTASAFTGINAVLAGGLTTAAGPQGATLWPVAAQPNANAAYNQLTPQPYVKGCGRVIGMGFEVVNTTSELNKQGQVTAWRMPTFFSPTTAYQGVATTPPIELCRNWELTRFPPATIADATLLYGSRSWAAKEGAYVVSRQNSTVNLATLPSNTPIAYSLLDAPSVIAGDPQDIWITPDNFLQDAGSSATWVCPFDTSGVHFTGLSYTTTLTVNVRWIIERIPGPREPDLVVLATPSAAYDSLALELYTRCMLDMPPGVMLSENPLGEWFRSALSKISEFAPKIGSMLSPIFPAAGLIGTGIGAGAKVVGNAVDELRSIRKTTKKAAKQQQLAPLKGSASTTQKQK